MVEHKGLGVRWRYLGYRLRELRRARGMSMEEVARALGMTHGEVCRLERARRAGRMEDLAALLGWYGVPKVEWQQLLAYTRPVGERGWFAGGDQVASLHQALIDLSGEIVRIEDYAPLSVPVLLHTGEYATALARAAYPRLSEAELNRQVAPHLVRQRILRHGVDYQAVIDEAGLRRGHADPQLWQRQLRHLIDHARSVNVSLRVLPRTASLIPYPFTMITFDDGAEVVYIGSLVAAMLLETREEIAAHRAALQHIADAAHSPAVSRSLLAALTGSSDTDGGRNSTHPPTVHSERLTAPVGETGLKPHRSSPQ